MWSGKWSPYSLTVRLSGGCAGWQVNRAAEDCATSLAHAIPAEQCVAILNPFIEAHEFPFNLAAIKMQIKVIEAAQDKDIVRSLLPTLIPRLLKVHSTRLTHSVCLSVCQSVLYINVVSYVVQHSNVVA